MLFIDEDFVNIVPQDLLERGINLREKLGFYEIAWKFDDVMEVLKITRDKGMIILGGDVYRLSGNEPIITHTTAGVPTGELIMHSKWRSNISLIIALKTEMILYIIRPLAPGRCPNENFNWIAQIKYRQPIKF